MSVSTLESLADVGSLLHCTKPRQCCASDITGSQSLDARDITTTVTMQHFTESSASEGAVSHPENYWMLLLRFQPCDSTMVTDWKAGRGRTWMCQPRKVLAVVFSSSSQRIFIFLNTSNLAFLPGIVSSSEAGRNEKKQTNMIFFFDRINANFFGFLCHKTQETHSNSLPSIGSLVGTYYSRMEKSSSNKNP